MSLKQRLSDSFPKLARLYWPCRSLFRIRSLEDVRFLAFYFVKVRQSRSQAMQDVFATYAWHRVGKPSGQEVRPAFVEVGAHEPERGSNSFMLEKAGWSGVLVEPNPVLASQLRDRRTSPVEEVACSNVTGAHLELRVPRYSNGHASVSGELEHGSEMVDVFPVRTKRLSDLIRERQLHLRLIYLSVDVEGYELEVLAGIDFSQQRFLAITVEHNFDAVRLMAIEQMLMENGYCRVFSNLSWFDAWFIPKEIEAM